MRVRARLKFLFCKFFVILDIFLVKLIYFVIKTLHAMPNGKVNETSFEYDNGNLVKESFVDSDGYTYKVSNVYDELGRVTETAYSDLRGNTSVTNSSYDKNGNLAEETVKEFCVRKTTFSYGKDALN